jgi:hypothetical protein
MRKPVIALLALGLLQMTADLFHLRALKGLAAATAASPAPKVFSSVRGLETYSSRFLVEWTDNSGILHSTEITPERAAGLRGPYNRRNVYGAVLAYGPVMQSDPALRPMFESVSSFALCGDAPLLRELGIDAKQIRGTLRIHLVTRSGSQIGDLPLVFRCTIFLVSCHGEQNYSRHKAFCQMAL